MIRAAPSFSVYLTLALASALFPPSAATSTRVGESSAQRPRVVINEVQYDPPPSGSDAAYEWVELLNVDLRPVAMSGWRIGDSRVASVMPDLELASGEFLIVAAGAGFDELYPGYAGRVVRLGGRIGNGLGNSGDQVRLLDAAGELVDGVSYGDDVALFNPCVSCVEPGHSLERYPAGADTDSAADWIDQPLPTPGQAATEEVGPPTSGPPAPTATAGQVVLNEFLPAPRDVDWDGDGTPSASDEWIELYSLADVDIDLRGWQLDDVADGGSAPYVIPEGTVLRSRGYLLFFRRDTRIALNNDRDAVRLLRPDGSTADETTYSRTAPDASYARQPDGLGPWTDSLSPSPGGPNGSPHPTPDPASPTPAPSATPGEGPTTPTPVGISSATPTGPRPTPTAPAGRTPAAGGGTPPAYLPFLITEVLYDSLASGDDAAQEWVELFNRTDEPVRTLGWSLGDAVAWDALGDLTLPPRGYLVVAASEATAHELAAQGATVWLVADGRIGNGLANKGDVVRVRGPTGEVADAVSYGANLGAFDPAVPLVPPGSSIERLPSDQDTDTADDWWPQPAPSPGRTGNLHEGAPEVVINELLPAPREVDWDASGVAGPADEWLELFNRSDFRADLSRWRLVVGEPERWSFRVPDGLVIEPHRHRLLHRRESGLSLGNRADSLRLVRSDGMVADLVRWERSPGYDRSLCRLPDGGSWTTDCLPTPGDANRPLPSPTPPETVPPTAVAEDTPKPAADYRDLGLAAVRLLGDGQAVAVRGMVVAPAGIFGPRTMYICDASSGLRLYLGVRDGELPVLPVGAAVAARGKLSSYHGERQLVLSGASEVWLEEWSWPPLQPQRAHTGEVGESAEGRLVLVAGQVTRVLGTSVWLDDGSGECRIRIDSRTNLRRPPLRRGQSWAVVGIVSQYAARRPYEGGYRVLPRFAADLQPHVLAAAGRAGRLVSGGGTARGLRLATAVRPGPAPQGADLLGLAGRARPAYPAAAQPRHGTAAGSLWAAPARWSLRYSPPVPL